MADVDRSVISITVTELNKCMRTCAALHKFWWFCVCSQFRGVLVLKLQAVLMIENGHTDLYCYCIGYQIKSSFIVYS